MRELVMFVTTTTVSSKKDKAKKALARQQTGLSHIRTMHKKATEREENMSQQLRNGLEKLQELINAACVPLFVRSCVRTCVHAYMRTCMHAGQVGMHVWCVCMCTSMHTCVVVRMQGVDD